MEVSLWSHLTEQEKDDVMCVLCGVFATLELNAIDAAEWYDSGFLKLVRMPNGSRIMVPEAPGSKNLMELAQIEYCET